MKDPQDKANLPEGTGSNEPQPVPPKKRRRVPVVLVVLLTIVATLGAIWVFSAVVTLPKLQNAREKACYILCSNNLKMIGLAARQYTMDYNDQFPLDLQAIRDLGYITDPLVYLCPSASKSPEPPPAFVTNYVYIGAGLKDDSSDNYNIPIAMDDPRNYDRHITILFKDGHIQGFSLPKKMTSCVEVLHHLLPDLDQSPEGRLVLENAQKADKGL